VNFDVMASNVDGNLPMLLIGNEKMLSLAAMLHTWNKFCAYVYV